MAVETRLIDVDPLTGDETWFHFDHADETFTLEQRAPDLAPILEHNRRLFNEAGSGWKGDMHHVATIPLTLLHQLKQRGVLDDAKSFKKWLADPDNRFFRTKAGAL